MVAHLYNRLHIDLIFSSTFTLSQLGIHNILIVRDVGHKFKLEKNKNKQSDFCAVHRAVYFIYINIPSPLIYVLLMIYYAVMRNPHRLTYILIKLFRDQ